MKISFLVSIASAVPYASISNSAINPLAADLQSKLLAAEFQSSNAESNPFAAELQSSTSAIKPLAAELQTVSDSLSKNSNYKSLMSTVHNLQSKEKDLSNVITPEVTKAQKFLYATLVTTKVDPINLLDNAPVKNKAVNDAVNVLKGLQDKLAATNSRYKAYLDYFKANKKSLKTDLEAVRAISKEGMETCQKISMKVVVGSRAMSMPTYEHPNYVSLSQNIKILTEKHIARGLGDTQRLEILNLQTKLKAALMRTGSDPLNLLTDVPVENKEVNEAWKKLKGLQDKLASTNSNFKAYLEFYRAMKKSLINDIIAIKAFSAQGVEWGNDYALQLVVTYSG